MRLTDGLEQRGRSALAGSLRSASSRPNARAQAWPQLGGDLLPWRRSTARPRRPARLRRQDELGVTYAERSTRRTACSNPERSSASWSASCARGAPHRRACTLARGGMLGVQEAGASWLRPRFRPGRGWSKRAGRLAAALPTAALEPFRSRAEASCGRANGRPAAPTRSRRARPAVVGRRRGGDRAGRKARGSRLGGSPAWLRIGHRPTPSGRGTCSVVLGGSRADLRRCLLSIGSGEHRFAFSSFSRRRGTQLRPLPPGRVLDESLQALSFSASDSTVTVSPSSMTEVVCRLMHRRAREPRSHRADTVSRPERPPAARATCDWRSSRACRHGPPRRPLQRGDHDG